MEKIRVTVIYDATMPEDNKLAREIGEAFEARVTADAVGAGSMESRYAVTLRGISDPVEMSAFLHGTGPENCQILVDINMTGYENETTGGFAAINRLPMDILNVITGDALRFDEFLKKNQSYMSRFILLDESVADAMEEKHPHLWHVEYLKDADSVAEYAAGMELRYRDLSVDAGSGEETI